MHLRAMRLIWACALGMLLAGCGGDSPDPDAPVTLFRLNQAYKGWLTAGSTDNFSISGACIGTAKVVTSPATSPTFEGVPGYSSAQATSYAFNFCLPLTSVVAGAAYFDAQDALLGDMTTGVEYAKASTAAAPLPLLVKVGDSAVYAKLTVYADSSKAVATGSRVMSYRVDADGPRSAFVTLVAQGYDNAGLLSYTEQIKFRITAEAGLAMTAVDAQYGTGPAGHFVYTKVP